MDKYSINIEIPKGELKEILDKLTDAQETVYECYSRLEQLGVLKMVEATSDK